MWWCMVGGAGSGVVVCVVLLVVGSGVGGGVLWWFEGIFSPCFRHTWTMHLALRTPTGLILIKDGTRCVPLPKPMSNWKRELPPPP